MPREGSWPSGGLKVIFEYASRLAEDGYDIKLIYPLFRINESIDWLHKIVYIFVFLKIKLTGSFKPTNWFILNKKIHNKLVWSLETYCYENKAIYIATAIHTAYSLNKYNIPSTRKFYFIQGYENWAFTDQQVIDSYHFPMHKIAISRWLEKIIEAEGESCSIVYNGFDFNVFRIKKAIKNRSKSHIICLYHKSKLKDFQVAKAAFERVKAVCPELRITLFGVPPDPVLPKWYSYYQKPNKEILSDLYNEASIYVGPSRVEGWGLTIGEAMLCGCAVACTNNSGYLEMAKNNDTALVSEIGDADALAQNIISLINDDELRYRIARAGNRFIQKFSIEDSYLKFRKIITSE